MPVGASMGVHLGGDRDAHLRRRAQTEGEGDGGRLRMPMAQRHAARGGDRHPRDPHSMPAALVPVRGPARMLGAGVALPRSFFFFFFFFFLFEFFFFAFFGFLFAFFFAFEGFFFLFAFFFFFFFFEFQPRGGEARLPRRAALRLACAAGAADLRRRGERQQRREQQGDRGRDRDAQRGRAWKLHVSLIVTAATRLEPLRSRWPGVPMASSSRHEHGRTARSNRAVTPPSQARHRRTTPRLLDARRMAVRRLAVIEQRRISTADHSRKERILRHRKALMGVVGTLAATLAVGLGIASANSPHEPRFKPGPPSSYATTSTPIKHLVVIFQENVSFDHYFATYPNATNPAGEPPFTALPGTPSVNGLSGSLLTANPNLSNPQRLDRSEAMTCDQDHGYTAEQKAFDSGLMDKFVQNTGREKTAAECTGKASGSEPNYAVMDYYDGNTVTGLWNYAQHFALSDNSFGTTYGPSSPGAVNVTSGNTYGAICGPAKAVYNAPACEEGSITSTTPGQAGPQGQGTMYSDADPYYDICSYTEDKGNAAGTIKMGGRNVGDLLDEHGVSWGWFEGGFASPGYVPGKPATDNLSQVCTETHENVGGGVVNDYSPHHEPFQFYASTANPQHLPPTSIAAIGHQDQANHQYDMRDFWAAASSGNLPAVSYLKAPAYQDGHAGYSDPIDEQRFLVETINKLEKLPSWSSTAVVINWDDSDGWYDHQMGPVVTQSQTSLDALTGTGTCGTNLAAVPTFEGTAQQARCGVGPRIPLLAISPYAKSNYVDNTFTDQTSIVKFIEENWQLGSLGGGSADEAAGSLQNMFEFGGRRHWDRRLILEPSTGEPLYAHDSSWGRGRHGRR